MQEKDRATTPQHFVMYNLVSQDNSAHILICLCDGLFFACLLPLPLVGEG